MTDKNELFLLFDFEDSSVSLRLVIAQLFHQKNVLAELNVNLFGQNIHPCFFRSRKYAFHFFPYTLSLTFSGSRFNVMTKNGTLLFIHYIPLLTKEATTTHRPILGRHKINLTAKVTFNFKNYITVSLNNTSLF